MQETAVRLIKKRLKEKNIKVIKIILFGSRAKGDFKDDSDWDFLVVVNCEPEPREKRGIIGDLQVALAQLKIPNDILIMSEKRFSERSEDIGNIAYYAVKEGQML